jgi:ParB family chromosome partitioning protein
VTSQLRDITTDQIDLPPQPVRRYLGDIASLADSMQEYGLQQPISVRETGDRFMLTSGLRRLSAARMLGWTSIAAFVRTVSADQAYVVDLVENLQRQDLSPEEEADALAELVTSRGWTLQQVADAVKRSVGYVSKRVRVFEDPLLRDAIVERGLPISTAEELLASDPEQRSVWIERAITLHWDQAQVREALHPLGSPSDGLIGGPSTSGGPVDERTLGSRSEADSAQLLEQRPPGLTRAIREFHRLVLNVRADDLTTADRAALRSLFRDLVMLARASTQPTEPVFPPMPAATAPESSGRKRRSAAKEQRRTP